MHKLSVILMACLLASNTYAADIEPLAPGAPAGVGHAQIWNAKNLAGVAGGVGLIVAFSLLISGGSSIVTSSISGGSGNFVIVPITTTTTTTTTTK